MNIIIPNAMTPARLVSTNATESNPTYAAATTYALNARVIYGTFIYQSLVASNVGSQPDISPTKWVRVGPTNAWAMFDDQVSSQTTRTDNLTVTFATGIIDTLAVLGIDAEKVTLTMRDGAGGPIVYEQTQSVTGNQVFNWYEYFFSDPSIRRTQTLFLNLPPFASAHVTLTVTSIGTVKVGHVAFGRVTELGCTSFDAQAGITDYSRKETDEFGTTTFVKRAFSKTLTCSVQVATFEVNRVQRILYDLRATPVVWIASDNPEYSEPLIVYGFYRDFYCSISQPTLSTYQLEIEGLV